MNVAVIHTDSGGYSWDPLTRQKGAPYWRLRNGRTYLTAAGKANLGGWREIMISIPAREQQYDRSVRPGIAHPTAAAPRDTFYTITERMVPGLEGALNDLVLGNVDFMDNFAMADIDANGLLMPWRIPDNAPLPQAFKDWVLGRLGMLEDDKINEGSDRAWFYRNDGTPWYVSIQRTTGWGGACRSCRI